MKRVCLVAVLVSVAAAAAPARADTSCLLTVQTSHVCTYTTTGPSEIVSEVTLNSSWTATVVRNGKTIVLASNATNGLPDCKGALSLPGETVTVTFNPGGIVPAGEVFAKDGRDAC